MANINADYEIIPSVDTNFVANSDNVYVHTNYNSGSSSTLKTNSSYILPGGTTGVQVKSLTRVLKELYEGIGTGGTDEKVKQTNTTGNAVYNLLFSYTSSTTTEKTEQARKSSYLTYNPSTYAFTINGCTQQYDTASKCLKFVFS